MVSGPSGVGKTTLLAEVIARRPNTVVSPSVTTRPPRPGERDQSKYRFLTPADFAAKVSHGDLLEHATYAGHSYGTPRSPVDAWLAEGTDVVLEIEVQGAEQVKRAKPDAVLIFIDPPSWEVLEERLRQRATEDHDSLERRLATARQELAAAGRFEHRVINDDLGKAVEEVLRIMGPPDSRKDEA